MDIRSAQLFTMNNCPIIWHLTLVTHHELGLPPSIHPRPYPHRKILDTSSMSQWLVDCMPQIFDIFGLVIDVFLTYTRQLTCLDEGLVWWCGVLVNHFPWTSPSKNWFGAFWRKAPTNDIQIVHWCFSKNKEKVGPFAKMWKSNLKFLLCF